MTWIDDHTGVILAVLGFIVFIDGLPRLARWGKLATRTKLWLSIYTVCGLGAVMVGYRGSIVQDQKDAAIATTAVSAQAEASGVDMRTSPRSLSLRAEVAIAAELSPFRGTSFNLNEQNGSTEAHNFGDEIGAVLQHAGWSTAEYVPNTFSTQVDSLAVYYKPTAKNAALALASQLRAYGFRPAVIRDPGMKPGEIGVWVGAKS